MTLLFQYFQQFNLLSKEAEKAIAEISSIVTIKKSKDLQPIGNTCPLAANVKPATSLRTGNQRNENLK